MTVEEAGRLYREWCEDAVEEACIRWQTCADCHGNWLAVDAASLQVDLAIAEQHRSHPAPSWLARHEAADAAWVAQRESIAWA